MMLVVIMWIFASTHLGVMDITTFLSDDEMKIFHKTVESLRN